MSSTQNDGQKLWPIDQYEDLAKYYDKAIGSLDQRTDMYKQFFADILKDHNCHHVLDTSCGTGVDSIILLEHGFNVVSVDLSAHMLEYARKYRALKKGQPRYDGWIIEQANWETLQQDLAAFLPEGTQFDGMVCLANSIAHILNEDGRNTLQRKCLRNFAKCVRPGGVLIVDHRNYDAMLNNVPLIAEGNVYYKYQNSVDIRSKLIMKHGRPHKVALQFSVKDETGSSELKMFQYPHRVAGFTKLLDEAFDHNASHTIYGDFKPLGEVSVPGFYQHVMVKY